MARPISDRLERIVLFYPCKDYETPFFLNDPSVRIRIVDDLTATRFLRKWRLPKTTIRLTTLSYTKRRTNFIVESYLFHGKSIPFFEYESRFVARLDTVGMEEIGRWRVLPSSDGDDRPIMAKRKNIKLRVHRRGVASCLSSLIVGRRFIVRLVTWSTWETSKLIQIFWISLLYREGIARIGFRISFFFLTPYSFLSLSINRERKKREKKRTNLSECEYARPRINSANNHRGRQGRKRNDRRAAEGRTRRKDEWKRRGSSADHSLWLCSWLSRSSSFIHASTVPSMVFLPCGSAIYRGLLLYCNPTLNAFRPRSSLAKTFSTESRVDLLYHVPSVISMKSSPLDTI